MKHEHITPQDSRWDSRKYICVCGFETGDRQAFDSHLAEKSNQAPAADTKRSYSGDPDNNPRKEVDIFHAPML